MRFKLLDKSNRSYIMGVAILWVVLFHSGMFPEFYGIKDVYILKLFFANGYLGVDIFIFLSVFGLCHSFKGHSLLTFYKRRFMRLFPMYWVYLAVMVMAFPMIIGGHNLRFVLLQMTGMASFFSERIEWYIPFLILIYIAFPLIYRVFVFLSKKHLVNICVVLTIFLLRWSSKIPMDDYCLDRIPVILLAMQTYQFWDMPERYLKTFGWAVLAILLFTNNIALIFSVLIPVSLFLLSMTDVTLPFYRTFSWIGKYTLEIYLAQNLAFNQFLQISKLSYWQSMMVCLVIIVGASIVFHFVQKFFLELRLSNSGQ